MQRQQTNLATVLSEPGKAFDILARTLHSPAADGAHTIPYCNISELHWCKLHIKTARERGEPGSCCKIFKNAAGVCSCLPFCLHSILPLC